MTSKSCGLISHPLPVAGGGLHPLDPRRCAAAPSGSNSRTDPSGVPSDPAFGTPSTVLSGQVSSKTPFYAFCVATCRRFYPKWAAFGEGSPQKLRRTHLLWTPVPKVLNLYCVISGNTYLYTDKSYFMGHKYVCLRCRKCFSAGTDFTKFQDNKICPDCMTPMVLLNEKFKAPSKTDVAQWEIVKMLVDNGFRFQTLYDPVSGERILYPRTKTEAEEFIRKYKH